MTNSIPASGETHNSIPEKPNSIPACDNIIEVITQWTSNTMFKKMKKDDDLETKEEFSQNFYISLYQSIKEKSKEADNKEADKSRMFKDEVLVKLKKEKESLEKSTNKDKEKIENKLREIQTYIEDLTLSFSEGSIRRSTIGLMKMLIKEDEECAKDSLRAYLEDYPEDIALISEFGYYTIEAIIIYVLSELFSALEESSMIRLATLIEHLESTVREQALLLRSRRKETKLSSASSEKTTSKNEETTSKKKKKMYRIGTYLVNFMEKRNLVKLVYSSPDIKVVQKKGVSYYLPKHTYVMCNFDLTLLPIKLNLPMVCKPLDWRNIRCKPPRTLSDLSGGYLSMPTGEIYNRYRLLTSINYNNFYIDISQSGGNYEKLCSVMNKLQGQAFKVNRIWLNVIKTETDLLVKQGVLQPRFLASLNINDVSNLLREHYMRDASMQKLCDFSDCLKTVCKDIQNARYEEFIINLADAYDGYDFYLPAFLDFRGRIYRCGILHFHERDLARSLIHFSGTQFCNKDENDLIYIYAATAFHFQK